MHSFHFLLVRARCATDGASESVSTCVRFAHSQPKRGLALIYVDRGAAERMEKTSWSRTWGIRPAIRDLGLIICSVFCLVWVPCTHVCIVPMFLVSELLFMSGVCVCVCVCVCVWCVCMCVCVCVCVCVWCMCVCVCVCVCVCACVAPYCM